MVQQKLLQTFFPSSNVKKRPRETTSASDVEEKQNSSKLTAPASKKRKISAANPVSVSKLEEDIKTMKAELEPLQTAVNSTVNSMKQHYRNVSDELINRKSTIRALLKFQSEQLSGKPAATTFPEEYEKLLCVYMQDRTEADLEILADKIIDDWKIVRPNPADTTGNTVQSIPSFNFTREVLITKMKAIAGVTVYGIEKQPDLCINFRDVVHTDKLPKKIRSYVKSRKAELKQLTKHLKKDYKPMKTLLSKIKKAEKELNKLQKQEAKSQQKQIQKQPPKPANSITKFTTKMKAIEQDTDVVMTESGSVTGLSSEEIDRVLEAAQTTEYSTSLQIVLQEMNQRVVKKSNTSGRRVRFYMYSRIFDPEDKLVYFKRFSNNVTTAISSKKIGRGCWNKFQTDVDYEEPCYEDVEEEDLADEDIEGEDLMDEDDEEDLPILPGIEGMEDYDEDEDHDFVVHDGYVSGDEDEVMNSSDDESGNSMKSKTFNREENIQLKKQTARKRGKSGIELVVLDTQHYFCGDTRMDTLETMVVFSQRTTDVSQQFDFTDLSWFGDEKKDKSVLQSPSKRDSKAAVAEHTVPSDAVADGKLMWKQYMALPDLKKLATLADGYEGSKIKLSEEFVLQYPQPEDKKLRISKALVQRQIDEITFKEKAPRREKPQQTDPMAECASPRKGNNQVFRIYGYVVDVIDSQDPFGSDKPLASSVTSTPRRRRRYFKRISLGGSSSTPTASTANDENEEPSQKITVTESTPELHEAAKQLTVVEETDSTVATPQKTTRKELTSVDKSSNKSTITSYFSLNRQ
jgi:HAMP domain-containing protein